LLPPPHNQSFYEEREQQPEYQQVPLASAASADFKEIAGGKEECLKEERERIIRPG